jgi:hypothetical protein
MFYKVCKATEPGVYEVDDLEVVYRVRTNGSKSNLLRSFREKVSMRMSDEEAVTIGR